MEALIVLASLAVVIGLFLLTNATAGVGAICIGCFFAVLARIAQASRHRKAATEKPKE
jgi:hypothetical protein